MNAVFQPWLRRSFVIIILGCSLPVLSYALEAKNEADDDCVTRNFVIEYRNPKENPSAPKLLEKIRAAINGKVIYNGRVMDTFHSYSRRTCILRGEAKEILKKLKKMNEVQRVELDLPAYIAISN
ncbi:hypothetical protein [Chitinolyticbacter meiyuanensis]|uniref:hypothetical protein n=1 Tax=Chitinolyticbacter meiyuanensis TaxID=682798 RepID=UPI0011E5FD4F|nr:hypothetical protein [Chitinolyticbacter meiyuanensis]